MSEYKKLGKNVLLITIGNFSSKILSFFFIPLYTAILSTEEYGISDLITTSVNLMLPFFTVLISEAIMRFALDKNYDRKQIFTLGILVSVIGLVVVFALSPLIQLSDTLKDYYLIFLLFYTATMFHTVISQFVKGIEDVMSYTISGVIGTVTYILFNILFLVILKTGLSGYLVSHILSNLITTVYMIFSAKLWKYIISPLCLSKKYLKDMLKYSIPLIPNSISWWISNSSDKYIVTAICGVAMTGIYSVSYRIPSLFSVLSTIFMNAWQISAANTFDADDSSLFYTNIYNMYNSFNVIFVSAMICSTKLIADILFQKDFFSAWVFVPVLLIGYVFNAMSGFLGTIYTSAKKTHMVFFSTLIGALTNVVLNLVLVYWIGAMGAAIATFVSYMLIWIIRIIDTRRILKLNIKLLNNLSCYILLIVQCILICLDSKYSLFISIILFVVMLGINKNTIINVISVILSKFLKRGNKI